MPTQYPLESAGSSPDGARHGNGALTGAGIDQSQSRGFAESAQHWCLRANCSLPPQSLLAILLSLGAISLLIATAFWFLGAPLIFPFACVEMLCLIIAMLMYAGRARDGEEVWLRGHELHLHSYRRGQEREWIFPTGGSAVTCSEATGGWIELACGHQRVRFGGQLPAPQRRQVANAIRAAVRAQGSLGLELN